MTETRRAPRQDGAAIRQARRERGIKPGQLADRCGVASKTVSNLERGNGQASVELMHRIALALEVPVADLLSDSGRQELEVAR